MKKNRKRIFLFLVLFFCCFFCGYHEIGAAIKTQINEDAYNNMLKKVDGAIVDDTIESSGGQRFDLCFYELGKKPGVFLDNGFLRDGFFGYALISFNPAVTDADGNETNGAFYFSWNFFYKSFIALSSGASNTFYYSNYGGQSMVYYDELKNPSGSNKFSYFDETSLDGDEKFGYIRLDADAVKKLKQGQCPSYADYTSGGWKDDAGVKRLCFTDTPGKCNDQGNAWDNDNTQYENLSFFTCKDKKNKYTDEESVINCMTNYVELAAKNISGITYNDEYCKAESYASAAEDKIDTMLTAARAVVKGARNTEVTASLNIFKRSGNKLALGLPIYNQDNSVTNLVNAYNDKTDEILTTCISKNLIEEEEAEEWKNQVNQSVLESVNVIQNGSITDFGTIIEGCAEIKGTDFYKNLQYVFTAIKITTPVLALVLITKDFVSAATAGKEEEMKKAQKNAIIRLIVGVLIFLLPTLVNVIISYVDYINEGTCGIK